MTDRFKPSRAGVINIWDYVDEEWAFADGRIALRGHNGSGKTKALEVLFPFVLDGVADSRRLDPFSGENRTMKSNLLFRGQESEYGYVWMEFALAREDDAASEPRSASEPRVGAETVTLIIGMRAHRNSDGVRMSFFVTGLRVGVDFGLLSADSRPLTERQLRAVLEPEAWRRTATEYRDLVDHRLFGLGRERYSQLLDLLLALRRPLLAKDLDPAKVSDTLTSGLSPVDDDLVQQAARDFENLAAVQKLFDDLTAANAAVGEFTTHYEAYLRSHVKFALDRVQARSDVAADHAGRLTVAAVSRRRSVAAERAAEADREASRTEGERLQGRLAGLKNSEEYKAQGRIEDKRREVASRAAEVARQRGGLDRDRRRLADQAAAVGKLAQRVTGSRAEAGRLAAALADAAQRSGITDDGFGPVDAGDELLATARARVAARRDDIGEIRRLLDAIRDAKAKRAYAEQELTRKVAAHERQQRDADTAAARLAEVRQVAAADLATWSTRWAALAGEDDLAGSLAEALELIGNAGAPRLAEVYDDRTAARQAAAIAARTTLDAALGQVRRRLTELRAERDVIAAEQDDAPPASDLRPAARDARPGAPLWQLVRFAPETPDQTAAAIEGALYGAGLLTAWVHPDPALTRTALEAAEADGYLIPTAGSASGASPGAASSGARTLADVLIPEDQEHVPADVIVAVLRSITLTDDIMAAGSDIPAPAASRGVDYVFGYAPAPRAARSVASADQPMISTKAQFSYGVHVGARPKQTPEYIGATNRANRRRARLAEQDDLIAAAAGEERTLAQQAERAAGQQEDFRRARRELPDTRPVAKAAETASTQAALLARSREDAETARGTLDSAVAETDARTRQLRQAAAERRMPTDSGDVDAIARAAAEFENAASDLHKERAAVVRAEEDLAERSEAVERQRLEYAEQETALEEAERAQAALDEEFRSLEEALQTDVQRVLEQIRQTERDLKAAQGAYQDHDGRARLEHDKVTAADRDLHNERQSLADAIGQLFDQASAFGEFARPDLRPLLGVSTARAWPDPAAWPDAGRASEDLANVLAAEADQAGEAGEAGKAEEAEAPPEADTTSPPAPDAAVRAVLPAAATEILDAFAAATRGGRQVTEGALKNTADRMSVALKDFTDALAACEEDYRVDWEPGGAGLVIVNVIDDEGRKPVAGFATRIDERAKDQGVLLEDRERKVLEDELLAALAGQIHARVVAARDLTRNMNSDTRSKPMSSGISVGIRWAQSDRITDAQRKASHLLDRDTPGPERLAELRGVLRDMIREYRAGHPRATYREALGSVLDYRSWHAFELILITPGEGEQRLTRAKHSVMSGGEKSAAIHLPLFAAANALYSSAKEHCPRLIALDEAFVGIDERYKPDLFGLAVKFDLDLFMTGHDLWVTTDTVPMIAHYDLYHDKVTRTTSALLILWDGEQLIDATAGFKDNEELTTQLLGFRPTRHAPLGTDATLYVTALGADPDDLEDDEG